MAALCHFWGFAPADYWALTVQEHTALVRFMVELEREREQQALTRAARSRRGIGG